MSSKDKKKRVEAEAERLRELFAANADNEKAYIEKQVSQLAWLNVSIKDLQISIDKVGSTVEYANGPSQYGIRKNPDIDTLVQYQKLANSIAANLVKLLKKDLQVGDKLREFLEDY